MQRYKSGEKVGKYKIISILGEGGIGIVYRAEHMTLGTEVALKMCKLQNSSAQERLRIEGKAQTKLKHPNIVSVYDMFEVDHAPCLVMEYVSGIGLDDWLKKYTMTIKQAQTLFLQILDAMEYAHSQKTIHRDLKPSNIMITEINGRPFPKVCDFGLAKIQDQTGPNLTKTGAMMGTPAYMAPEQIRDAKGTDHRGDVFSLGAIYYELITGTMAFSGADTLELLNSVANEPHRPPTDFIPNLEERHNKAIQGALIKDPYQRIPSCKVFREVLLGETTWIDPKLNLASHQTLLGDEAQTLGFVRSTSPIDEEKTELITRTPKHTIQKTIPNTPPLQQPKKNALHYRLLKIFLLGFGFICGFGLLVLFNNEESPDKRQSLTISKPKIQTVTKTQEIVEEETSKETFIKKTSTKKQVQTSIKKKSLKKVTKTKPQTTTTIRKKETTTPPPMALVSFSGADGLELEGSNGTFPAGSIPAGTYDVYGIFKTRRIRVGKITLKENQKKQFICTAMMTCD